MRHSILMAYSRPKNARILADHMRGQGVEWRPLCSQLDIDGNPCDTVASLPKEDWIKPWKAELPTKARIDPQGHQSQNVPAVNPGNWLVDKFFDEMKERNPEDRSKGEGFFFDDHYLSFMTDDCLWHDQHWKILQAHFRPNFSVEHRPKMVVCAHRFRENVCPAISGKGPNGFLWENNSLLCFSTRVEALTVRADLMRDIRFGELWCADGMLVERLKRENPSSVALANDTLVYWSALNPADWGFAHHER